ncbi:MAG: homoserine dehydrogenase [Gaiellales bacterium]
MSSTPIGIGLLGYGTVGSAVDRLLTARAADVERVVGAPVEVRRALVRNLAAPRDSAPRDGLLTDDFAAIRDDASISVVAEVMGGVSPTREWMLELFAAGKSVVTANKQLLARHGAELFAAAEANGVQLRFEASVCAAIPVVKVLRESMIASEVNAVLGFVNGTTNFMLTKMAEGADYATVLAEAQRLGYAEADPTEDVTGGDAAAKVAILASIAFHTEVTIADVPHEGIDTLDSVDVAFAHDLGYSVKLIGQARRADAGVVVGVAPMLVPHAHPLSGVNGSFNAVMLRGDAIREVTLVGPGAGGDETASAVIGDLMGVLGTSGTGFPRTAGVFRQLPLVPAADVESALYIRLDVKDEPGVLAKIAAILAEEAVSIDSVVQRASGGRAQLVIVTHAAPEGAARRAISAIEATGVCASSPVTLRVLAAS